MGGYGGDTGGVEVSGMEAMQDDFDEGESDLEACVLHGNGSLAMAWCLWVGVERGNIDEDGDVMRLEAMKERRSQSSWWFYGGA